MKSRVYHEVQYMRKTVFIFIIIGFTLLAFGGMLVVFLVEGKDRDPNEMIISSAIIVVVMFLLYWLLFTLYLDVRIEENRLVYKMPPLINGEKSISRTEIDKFEIVNSYPIRRYGGWGIRYSLKHGKALTISGNKGLKLYLKNGKTLLLGTQDPEGIGNAMENMMDKGSDYV